MVLVYKNLQNWVISSGKGWFAYSSTMVRIWDLKTGHPMRALGAK
jgi:hypothetical protein